MKNFKIIVALMMIICVTYILKSGKIIHTMLYWVYEFIGDLNPVLSIVIIFLVISVFEFFIGSGSAKAFLLMPLIVPLAEAFGISAQLCVMAFAFGDGFSNVFYPTNPVLLISIGLANVSYGTWAKWSGKFQLLNLFVTCGLLLLGMMIGYA